MGDGLTASGETMGVTPAEGEGLDAASVSEPRFTGVPAGRGWVSSSMPVDALEKISFQMPSNAAFREVAFLSLEVAQIVVILCFKFVNLCRAVDRIIFISYIYRAGILPSY